MRKLLIVLGLSTSALAACTAAGSAAAPAVQTAAAGPEVTDGAVRSSEGVGCETRQKENLLNRLLTDAHSSSEQRGAVVRNLDPWYSASNAQPHGMVFLAAERRIRIC